MLKRSGKLLLPAACSYFIFRILTSVSGWPFRSSSSSVRSVPS
jgi:hypothetical protein